MGFPTRACMEPTSDDAMKQSLRLVKDVSLSMSWNAESLPAEKDNAEMARQGLVAGASLGDTPCFAIDAVLYLRFTAALGNYHH